MVTSNVPLSDTCVAGGIAWVNTFDFKTGGYVAGVNACRVSSKISGSVAVGINVIMLPGGKVVTVVTTADNQQLPQNTPMRRPASRAGASWRESSTPTIEARAAGRDVRARLPGSPDWAPSLSRSQDTPASPGTPAGCSPR